MATVRDVVIEHPNRDKASSQLARAAVVLLLLATATLLTIITIGGWDTLQGVKPLQVAFIAVNVVMAFYIARWNRGVLPVAAALAMLLAIFAVISAPSWFDRDQPGFAESTIDAATLGTLTWIVAPLQLAVMVVAMVAFAQKWNIEYERPRRSDEYGSGEQPPPQQQLPAPA